MVCNDGKKPAKKAIGYVMWEKWMSHIKEQGGIVRYRISYY